LLKERVLRLKPREVSNRGLKYLIDPLPTETPEVMDGGFNMHFRLDGKEGVYAYNLENENDNLITIDDDSKQLMAKLASAAISAASVFCLRGKKRNNQQEYYSLLNNLLAYAKS